MVKDFLVSCLAAAHQEGFFSMALIDIDNEDTDNRTGSSSKEGRGCGKISGSPWPANGRKGHRSR